MGKVPEGTPCKINNPNNPTCIGIAEIKGIQNNFPDPQGKQYNPFSTNNNVFIQPSNENDLQQTAENKNHIIISRKKEDKDKDKDLPRVKDEYESEEFKQLLIPNTRTEAEESADNLCIDG